MALNHIDVKYFKEAVGISNIGKETDVDISARCPICGDSTNKKNSKRLHLYNKGDVTNINCFNGGCGCQNKTVYSFLRDYYPDLLPNYKRETFGDTINNFKNQSTLGDLVKKDDKHTNIVLHDLTQYMKPITESPEALNYVKSRGFEYTRLDFGEWYYGYQDLKIGETLYKTNNSIIIPLYYDNKMYGFYSRSIVDKNFSTYMSEHNIGYKIWNWFNVDKSKPVYIFEGIFDAISSGLTNVIALLGAKLPEERLTEMKEPVFVLDNDRTGLLNSVEYANKGYKVYIQPTEFKEKDMNELMLNNDINVSEVITKNIYKGLSASTRIKAKL